MTTKRTLETSGGFPTLEELAELASKGDYDSVLLGLAKRADARVERLYERAVGTFDAITKNPKGSLGAAENAGDQAAGPTPNDSEALINALLERVLKHRPAQPTKRRMCLGCHERPMGEPSMGDPLGIFCCDHCAKEHKGLNLG